MSEDMQSEEEAADSAKVDIEGMNVVIRMLNKEYIGDSKCNGELAGSCVCCRAVNLRTSLRSFAHELTDLYRLDNEMVE